jgi:hypothetical protein
MLVVRVSGSILFSGVLITVDFEGVATPDSPAIRNEFEPGEELANASAPSL